jgi:hypothetical protein
MVLALGAERNERRVETYMIVLPLLLNVLTRECNPNGAKDEREHNRIQKNDDLARAKLA